MGNTVSIRKSNSRKRVVKHIVCQILAGREVYSADTFVGLEFEVKWQGSKIHTWEPAANLIEHGWSKVLQEVVADPNMHAATLIQLA